MREANRSFTASATVWWLRGDGGVCAFCLQTFAHGAQHRCLACDRDVCPCCARHLHAPARSVRCPDCTDDTEAEVEA